MNFQQKDFLFEDKEEGKTYIIFNVDVAAMLDEQFCNCEATETAGYVKWSASILFKFEFEKKKLQLRQWLLYLIVCVCEKVPRNIEEVKRYVKL